MMRMTMPTAPISMRKLKEILRLKYGCKLSHRQIAKSLSVSPSIVSKYAAKSAELGITCWPLGAKCDDHSLQQAFFKTKPRLKGFTIHDWSLVQQELRPKTMTLLLLWEEYKERLSLLLEHEITQRDQRKIDRLTRQAKFRVSGTLAQLNYGAARQLDKTQIRSLAQGEWLRLHQNILITGSTGCGKTYLACALGQNHCQQGNSVYYFRLKELLEKMFLAQADGSYRKLINKLSSASLLILDDWGLEPLTAQQRSDLLELIDVRYDTKSTLIASQLPIANWYEMIGESTHADAILDRLVHGAIKLELKGESMRKKLNSLTDADHSS